MDERLVSLVFRAIGNVEKWQDVLRHVALETQAKAVMITLRDKTSNQIVDDIHLLQEFHSPLIYGFPEEAVVFYLGNLRTQDPWADAQKTHYPTRPIVMSRVCDQSQYEGHPFFTWLNAGGIQDSLVVELNALPKHWSALNLFFAETDDTDVKAGKTYLEDNIDVLRDAWKTSQEFVHGAQRAVSSLEHMSNLSIPAAIVDEGGKVHQSNALFQSYCTQGWIRLTGTKHLLLPDGVSISGDADLLDTISRETWDDDFDLKIVVSRILSDPSFPENSEAYCLLTFHPSTFMPTNDAVANLLTRQELDLYKAIKAGKTVRDAGETIGIKRSRTFEIWNSVKQKLGVSSAHQIR